MKSAIVLLTSAASCWAAGLGSVQERQSNWTVGQTVQTSSGPVSGHAATNDSQVSEYLGIPFAQAPVGELRFAAPVGFNGTASLNGSAFGFSCPVATSTSSSYNSTELIAANITSAGVSVLALLSTPSGHFNEDCLYLNVWTKPQTGEAKKAVMVWIYGGGFNSGSSATPGYNGANIANQEDVVVVSFNYRLSILGFPGDPSGTQNLGLLDQRLAVEWVRDNIANFGGDPSRITIFGQSAGSVSVDLYSYAWTSDPIVAGVIGESGTAFSWGLPNSNASGAAAWYNVTTTLGCGDASSSSSSVLSCMRKQNYTAILNAIPKLSATAGILGIFGPTIDDIVVFSNYSQKTPAKLPMLLGNNNYEGGLFRTEFALEGITYPDVFWDDFNLQEFTCPAGIRANASLAAGNPTWRYRYMGVWPDLAISSEAGAWHASELPILFDTAPAEPPATQQEISFGNYMRGAWAAFAKDPQNGLGAYGWPAYNVSTESLVRLAYNNQTGINAVSPYLYDADCIFVNVSSTNTTNYAPLPDLGANATQMASSSASVPSETGSATATRTGPLSTVTSSGGSKVELSIFVGLGAFVMALLL